MIALDMNPFSIVEDCGFKRQIKELEPRYAVPSRIYFSRVVVPDIYLGVRTRM